jgi:hypothetical protein
VEDESMTRTRESLLQHYYQTRKNLISTLEGLTDEHLVERSLDGWSVKDHLAHLALWDDIRASEVVRISSGFHSAWRITGEQDEAYNALSFDARRDLSLDQVRWELETSRRRLLDAIEASTSDGLDPSRYGEAGLRSGHEAQHTGWIRQWREARGV